MYKVLKDSGNNANIIIENTETKRIVNIGRITMDILKILDDAGHKIGDDGTGLRDRWELEVSEEVGKTLARKAMVMTKPVRDQSKKEKPKKDNKHIDAMDVLLGLANYN